MGDKSNIDALDCEAAGFRSQAAQLETTRQETLLRPSFLLRPRLSAEVLEPPVTVEPELEHMGPRDVAELEASSKRARERRQAGEGGNQPEAHTGDYSTCPACDGAERPACFKYLAAPAPDRCARCGKPLEIEGDEGLCPGCTPGADHGFHAGRDR